jgi:predicted MFS family arabinose efflux permease
VPITLLLLFGGVIADRANKRRLLIMTQSVYAANALLLAVLAASGTARLWHIVTLSLVSGLVFAVDGPARQALVYDLVGADDLATGVAMQSASFNVARVMGPAFGSLIYVALGPAYCFLTNALSFGAVLLALALIRPSAHGNGRRDMRDVGGVGASFQYLRTSRPVRTILALTATASVFAVANYQTLMPAIAGDALGISERDARYGLLFSAIGCGSLLGVYLVGRNANAGKRGRVVFGGAFALGAALIALGGVRSYPLAIAVLFLVGMAAVSQLATANTLTQTLAPNGLRARAVSLHMFAMGGLQPFGAAIAGTIAQAFGVGAALRVGGATLVALTATLLLARREVARLA